MCETRTIAFDATQHAPARSKAPIPAAANTAGARPPVSSLGRWTLDVPPAGCPAVAAVYDRRFW